MEDKIYYGRGCLEQHDDYMKFINYVFAPDDSTFFENLLPKLYSPEQNPAYNSFIAVEDGEFRAAVGAFPCEMMVCGKKLKGVGIGNVACHPEHRSKGFMSKLMNLAGKTNIDQNQRALLSALQPYLTQQRLQKLEKAMRSARLAGAASSLLPNGIPFLSGR